MAQLDLDLKEARRRRDSGIERAADHAEAEREGWKAEALKRFTEYARSHAEFITEDVRAANADFPMPPGTTARAWGGIALKACRQGVVEKVGYREARDPKVHCSVNTLWRSRILTKAAA